MKQFKLFVPFSNLVHGISEASDGNIDSRFGNAKDARNNLTTIVSQLYTTTDQLIQTEQVHSSKIIVIDSAQDARELKGTTVPGVDGLLTNQSNTFLLVRTADCFPVFFYDPKHHTVGLIHVGWRGALANIHLAALDRLQQFFESRIQDILIAIGPGICPNCYQFKTKPVQADMPDWGQFVHKKTNSWSIDLRGFIEKSLLQAGIAQKNLAVIDDCTCHNPRWFSHIRSLKTGEPEGRFTNIIGIKSQISSVK